MKKKLLSFVVMLVFLFCVNIFDVYAKEYNINGIRIEIDDNSVLLHNGVEYARDDVFYGTRGSVISFAMADVTNEGNGDMTFTLETYAHKACDEITQAGFVDVWNEKTQAWDTIYDCYFERKQEDYPDDPLISFSSSFTIKRLEYDKYYRLTGVHQVRLGDIIQGFDTQTDGVKLEHH